MRSRSWATHSSDLTSALAEPVWSCTTSRSRRASMQGMPCSRSAKVRASSHSRTARLSGWASHQQRLGLASRSGQGLCLSYLGLFSRSTSSCSSIRLSVARRSTLMMISPHTSDPCVQSSAACSACSVSTRGLVSGGRSAFSPCMRGSWCHVICALCLQAVAVLQRRHEYSTQHLQGVETAAGQHMPAPDVAVAPGAWLIVLRMMRFIYEDEHGTHGQRGRSGR